MPSSVKFHREAFLPQFLILKPGLHLSRKDRKHMLANMFLKSSGYGLGSVYTGRDLFGTGTKLVRISLVFKRELVVRHGSDLLSGAK